jgi:hypothetical protein
VWLSLGVFPRPGDAVTTNVVKAVFHLSAEVVTRGLLTDQEVKPELLPFRPLPRRLADCLDQADDATAQPEVVDAVESDRQPLAVFGAEKLHEDIRGDIALESAGRAFKKPGGRDAEGLADPLQTAGADPIGSHFVFLDLLEGHADRRAEVGLADVDLETPYPDSAADVLVDRIRLRAFGRHFGSLHATRHCRGKASLPQRDLPSYGLFPYFGKRLDGVLGVESDGFRPLHQLDHFDELLPSLDVADVVLPALQTLREVNLAQTSLLALLNKKAAQLVMSGRIECASHPS